MLLRQTLDCFAGHGHDAHAGTVLDLALSLNVNYPGMGRKIFSQPGGDGYEVQTLAIKAKKRLMDGWNAQMAVNNTCLPGSTPQVVTVANYHHPPIMLVQTILSYDICRMLSSSAALPLPRLLAKQVFYPSGPARHVTTQTIHAV
jgi:hypothetical protein